MNTHFVEYVSPLSDKLESKRFMGKYAYENAWSYAKDRYENYWMTIDVSLYEIVNKKKIRKLIWNKI